MANMKNAWLDAWHDPMADVHAYSSCIATADVFADGDTKLLIADSDNKLKLYKGTSILSEHPIMSEPTALCIIFTDLHQPRTPAIAVASGPFVYIYRNLRPYFKFTLPTKTIDEKELEAWNNVTINDESIREAIETLTSLRSSGVTLSTRSSDLLALTSAHSQKDYVLNILDNDEAFEETTNVTCMTTIFKSMKDWDAIRVLAIGTSDKKVLILDKISSKVDTTINLPSTPAFLSATGLLDVEYRVAVACRNGTIYSIKNGDLMRKTIDPESLPSGIVLLDKSLYVGTMDKTFMSFHIKGKKNWGMSVAPHDIVSMVPMELKRTKDASGVFIALSNGDVRLYHEKNLLSEISTGKYITGMSFGPYGREDATLILTHKSGGISAKILGRSARFDVTKSIAGPPPEQDIPIAVPKKTKLYVEQTQREREHSVEMHQLFQRDLCKLRLDTAKAYVKVISEGQGPSSAVSSGKTAIRLNAQVAGIGPFFKIKLNLQNANTSSGAPAAMNIPIAFHFDHELYRLKQSLIWIPVLLPGVSYRYEVSVESLSETGAADTIYIFVCDQESCIPLVSAAVTMPISEPLFD